MAWMSEATSGTKVAGNSHPHSLRSCGLTFDVSETKPPPCRSRRPAISSSSNTIRTTDGELFDRGTRSSISTAVGPSRARTRVRSSGAGSVPEKKPPSGVAACFLPGYVSLLHDRLQHGDDVGRFSDWRRALFDEAVRPLGPRIER